MAHVKVQIYTPHHYQLLLEGDKVEVWEYGPECPEMGDSGYGKKRLLAELTLGDVVIWENDPGGTYPIQLYYGGEIKLEMADGEIMCGDNFVHDLEHIRDVTRWKLWIDDQLDDPDQEWRHPPHDFWGAKSVQEAQGLVEEFGPPYFMDLDCDLGEGGRVIDFLKWLQKEYPEEPPSWWVHSQNRIACEAVDSFMRSWHKVCGK